MLSNSSQPAEVARSVPPVDEEGAGNIALPFSDLAPAAASADIAPLTKDEGRFQGVADRVSARPFYSMSDLSAPFTLVRDGFAAVIS